MTTHAMVNVGLGRHYRDPGHAPFTSGHVPVTNTLADACRINVAGLDIDGLRR